MTQSTANTIARNLTRVRENIQRACDKTDRDPAAVALIAVTKSVGLDEVRALLDLDVTHLGENRLQDAIPKIEAIDGPVTWHMIGHIQRRKVPGVIEHFDYIDSIDRMSLAETLNEKAAKRLPGLIEINVSGEAAKHGFPTEETAEALAALRQMEQLDIHGLMTMAPLADDPESVRPYFAKLRALADANGCHECSMGMSGDYVVAVEEGATQVRIGRALFQS